jgi:hypothetical protein
MCREMTVEFWLRNFKGRHNLGDLAVNRRVMSEQILKSITV